MTEFIPRDTPIIIIGDYTQKRNDFAYQFTKKQYIDRFGFTDIRKFQTNNRRIDHINFFHDFYQLKRTDGTAPVHYRNKIRNVFSIIDHQPGMNHYNTKSINFWHLMKKISSLGKHTILLELDSEYIVKDIPDIVLDYDLYAFSKISLVEPPQVDLQSVGIDRYVQPIPNVMKSCIISPRYSRKMLKFMRDNKQWSSLDNFYELYSIKNKKSLYNSFYRLTKTVDVKTNFETIDDIDYEDRWITKD